MPLQFTTVLGWGLLPPPTGLNAVLAAGGSLTVAQAFFYVITALSGSGETTRSNEATGLAQHATRIPWAWLAGNVECCS
jgi:hypothetical protein